MREQDKHFIWSLIIAIGIIFVWKGLWEGLYEIPYLGNSWVALFVGFAMLTFSGLIFREFDPLGSLDKSVYKVLKGISKHPKKHNYSLKYHDQIKKKSIIIKGKQIKGIEKNTLIITGKNKREEIFIPLHRIKEVLHKGKTHWRL